MTVGAMIPAASSMQAGWNRHAGAADTTASNFDEDAAAETFRDVAEAAWKASETSEDATALTPHDKQGWQKASPSNAPHMPERARSEPCCWAFAK